MPRGSKDAYTDKQKRQAEHIEKGYKREGISDDEAERRAWATVNKESGGGKKSGSGRKSAARKSTAKTAKKSTTKSAKKSTKKAAKKSARKSTKRAAKKKS